MESGKGKIMLHYESKIQKYVDRVLNHYEIANRMTFVDFEGLMKQKKAEFSVIEKFVYY